MNTIKFYDEELPLKPWGESINVSGLWPRLEIKPGCALAALLDLLLIASPFRANAKGRGAKGCLLGGDTEDLVSR